MRSWIPFALMIGLVFLLCSSKLVAQEPASSAPTGSTTANKSRTLVKPDRYLIEPGDVLEFAVVSLPDLPKQYSVRADGIVHLPVVGEIHAAGFTIPQLSKEVDRKIRMELRNPTFRLGLLSVNPDQVVVLGEVNRPGRYEAPANLTVQELVALAGGYTVNADKTSLLIISNGTNKTVPLPDTLTKITLERNDVVSIPRGRNISVIGEVFKPGTYAVSAGPDGLQQALAQAGGVKPTSAMKRAFIFRPSTGSMTELTSMTASPDKPELGAVQEGDVLVVPPQQAIVFAGAPKPVSLAGGENVVDVLTAANINERMYLDDVRIVRAGTQKAEHVNLEEYFEKGNTSMLAPVNDGDVVLVNVPNPEPTFLQSLAQNLAPFALFLNLFGRF